MGRSILKGALWGSVASVAVLTLVSVAGPPPVPRDLLAANVPARSVADVSVTASTEPVSDSVVTEAAESEIAGHSEGESVAALPGETVARADIGGDSVAETPARDLAPAGMPTTETVRSNVRSEDAAPYVATVVADASVPDTRPESGLESGPESGSDTVVEGDALRAEVSASRVPGTEVPIGKAAVPDALAADVSVAVAPHRVASETVPPGMALTQSVPPDTASPGNPLADTILAAAPSTSVPSAAVPSTVAPPRVEREAPGQVLALRSGDGAAVGPLPARIATESAAEIPPEAVGADPGGVDTSAADVAIRTASVALPEVESAAPGAPPTDTLRAAYGAPSGAVLSGADLSSVPIAEEVTRLATSLAIPGPGSVALGTVPEVIPVQPAASGASVIGAAGQGQTRLARLGGPSVARPVVPGPDTTPDSAPDAMKVRALRPAGPVGPASTGESIAPLERDVAQATMAINVPARLVPSEGQLPLGPAPVLRVAGAQGAADRLRGTVLPTPPGLEALRPAQAVLAPDSDATGAPGRLPGTQTEPVETEPAETEPEAAGIGSRVVPLTEREPGSGVRINRPIGLGTAPESGSPATGAMPQVPPAGGLPGVGRRIVVGAPTEDPPGQGAGEEAAESALSQSDAAQPAYLRNAAPFDAPEDGRPFMAIVLVDTGEDGGVAEEISALGFPVSVAIVPQNPAAAQAAERHGVLGNEVLLAGAGLPDGATPRDAEISLSVHLNAVPNAVAVMADEAGGFAEDRALTDQVLQILADDGHGVLLWDQGLNPARSAAERSGRPTALIYRRIDSRDAGAGEITRRLDRAAFEARRTGSVIVVGDARPETLQALASWSVRDRAGEVTLAPVSAILRRTAE